MSISDLILSALQSLWSHRLRSTLSILGIVIGIGSFLLLYAVAESAREASERIINAFGSDIITVSQDSGIHGSGASSGKGLTLKDAQQIVTDCPAILEAWPEVSGDTKFSRFGPDGEETTFFPTSGIFVDYQAAFKFKLVDGRLLSAFDIDFDNQVCLAGRDIVEEWFSDKNPLGSSIPIRGYRFRIIGILDEVDFFGYGLPIANNTLFIPFPVGQRLFNPERINKIYLRPIETDTALRELRRYLTLRYGTHEKFDVTSQTKIIEAQKKQARIFEYMLLALGSISLLVGGIGIMNIMLVAVTERLREIGIRRALGSSRMDILLQFLFESVMLCAFGAFGGIVLGIFGSRWITRWIRTTPTFSIEMVVVALVIASAIGVIFGTYPAVRASRQNVAEVLRYE